MKPAKNKYWHSIFSSENSGYWVRSRKESLWIYTCKKKSKSWCIRFEVRNPPDNSVLFTLWSDQADPRRYKNSQRNSVPKVPPALCWCDLLQTARLIPLSLLKDSSESIGLHLESPKGGGWVEKKQSCTQLRFKKRRSCAEGEGRKAAGASSLCPGKRRAGNVPGPPSPTVKPRPCRGPPRTRVYWIAPCPAQGLPETPASGCPKKLWVSEEERKSREPDSGCCNQSTGIPDPASRTSFRRPDRPPERGNPDGPARMRIGCTLSPGIVPNAAKWSPRCDKPGLPKWESKPPVPFNPPPQKAPHAAPSPRNTVRECTR